VIKDKQVGEVLEEKDDPYEVMCEVTKWMMKSLDNCDYLT
jgi:hypothetical protein